MQRQKIIEDILRIFSREFEIEAPLFDADLRDTYGFDSIDAIELLREIEVLLGDKLTQSEKKQAMEIRTIDQIIAYVEEMAAARGITVDSDTEEISKGGV